jgi:hypothetical protein
MMEDFQPHFSHFSKKNILMILTRHVMKINFRPKSVAHLVKRKNK